ncbi:MAG: hypothetical protein K1Y01_06125 [Vicinamibacteria bacterium]|nr:hypothetical protein [Vicinamibacteria bacterium]
MRKPPALLAALLISANFSTAQDAAPVAATARAPRLWERRVDNTFFFVLNPLGVMDSLDVSWTKPINQSDDLLHKDAHLATGLMNRFTPAFARVGAWFEYSPLSVVDLRVGVEPIYYFGTFKAFLPFEKASANFDDDVIRERQGQAAAGFAGRAFFSPTLKARAGSVVARARAEVSRYKAAKAGEPYFYEPILDTLVRAKGSTVLTLEVLALREFDRGNGRKFLIGPVYDLTTVRQAPENRKQDIGAIAAWSKSGAFHSVSDPALAAKVVYFLEDPVRRHEAAAFITLGFRF